MPLIQAEVVEEVRRVDLLSWFMQNDPGNIVKLPGIQHCNL